MRTKEEFETLCANLTDDKEITNMAYRDPETDKLIDTYPDAMPIEILAKELNLPTLQQSVDDISTVKLLNCNLNWIRFHLKKR